MENDIHCLLIGPKGTYGSLIIPPYLKTSQYIYNMELYDTIIIGGGIAGLYTAYLLQKRNPKHRFIILEKQKYLGGRLLTYSDKYMTVE